MTRGYGDVAEGALPPRGSVRLALLGDASTGKTTLCSTLVSEAFPTTVPAVMHPIVVPADITPDKIRFTLVDTSTDHRDADSVSKEIQSCDVAVVVCGADNPETIARVTSYWLPQIRQLNPDVPIAVAVNKIDLIDESQRKAFMQPFQSLVESFQISLCMECSAKIQFHVAEVFYLAQKAVTHPFSPLYDRIHRELTPLFLMALTRIFRQCDVDMDGKLSPSELESFQSQCFEASLTETDVGSIMRILNLKDTAYIIDGCVSLEGFFYLHRVFIENGKAEASWRSLRKFGYDNNLEIREGFIDFPNNATSLDYRFELTIDHGLKWLYNVFRQYDLDQDGILNVEELDAMFFPCPGGSPFPQNYRSYVCTSPNGGLKISGWLSQWILLAFFEVRTALQTLVYLGYPGDRVSECVRPIKIGSSTPIIRNTVHCIVFGSPKCGKTALLDRMISKSIAPDAIPTQSFHTVANMLDVSDLYEADKETKFLIMTEVPATASMVNDAIQKDVNYCDLILLMYDVSAPHSLQFIVDLVKSRLPFRVPHILLAFKSDKPAMEQLDADGFSLSPSEFCKEYDLVALSSSAYREDISTLFKDITSAALLPEGFRPSTVAQRRRKRAWCWIRRGIVLTTFTSAAVFVSIRFNVLGKLKSFSLWNSKKQANK